MNSATSTDPGLRPWQLFLLAGMLAATAVVLVSTGQTMSSIVVLSATVVASSLVAVAGYRSLAPLAAEQDDAADAPVGGAPAPRSNARRRSCCARSRNSNSITPWARPPPLNSRTCAIA